jgi:hypothetical protein
MASSHTSRRTLATGRQPLLARQPFRSENGTTQAYRAFDLDTLRVPPTMASGGGRLLGLRDPIPEEGAHEGREDEPLIAAAPAFAPLPAVPEGGPEVKETSAAASSTPAGRAAPAGGQDASGDKWSKLQALKVRSARAGHTPVYPLTCTQNLLSAGFISKTEYRDRKAQLIDELTGTTCTRVSNDDGTVSATRYLKAQEGLPVVVPRPPPDFAEIESEKAIRVRAAIQMSWPLTVARGAAVRLRYGHAAVAVRASRTEAGPDAVLARRAAVRVPHAGGDAAAQGREEKAHGTGRRGGRREVHVCCQNLHRPQGPDEP